MPRAPFQVLVFPYRFVLGHNIEYAIFRREDLTGGYWQAIAGGGEENEEPIEAARREAFEEGGIPPTLLFLKLDSISTLPVEQVSSFLWDEGVLVIPEYCFAVEVSNIDLRLSKEHTEVRWANYEEAHHLLKWDSNKNALWELNYRLQNQRRS